MYRQVLGSKLVRIHPGIQPWYRFSHKINIKNVIAIFLFWPDYGVILEGKNELFKDRLAAAPKH